MVTEIELKPCLYGVCVYVACGENQQHDIVGTDPRPQCAHCGFKPEESPVVKELGWHPLPHDSEHEKFPVDRFVGDGDE